jgi:oligoendopeptidase F
MDVMYRYTRLRKKRLGVEELHMYDLYTPIVKDVTWPVTFEEAKEIVLKAMAPLGADYTALLQKGFHEGWIDVYENKGKRSGAYSSGARVHPYVLLNYQGTLDDVFTLAHEMGHAIHSYLSNTHQPTVYANYRIFVAEVASTCNEALLMEYLLSVTEDKKKRSYLLNYFLEQFRTTLYRQTMFAEFELEVNRMDERGEAITAEACNALYYRLNQEYFGPDVVVDREIGLEWARIPHFYYDYYVYQYATGYAAAVALSRRILDEGAPAVADYLRFLSGGCSADPITLLKGAGVDMATTEPVTQALELFGQLIDQLDQLTEE